MKNRLLTKLLPLLACVAFASLVAVEAESYNTAGDSVYVSAEVADASGIVTTVTTAGTYYAVKSATLFTAGEADGSSCITLSSTNGTFTVANNCGVGEVKLTACLADVVGANDAVINAAWHRTRGGTTTLVGATARRTEAASALRAGLPCLVTIEDVQLNDAFDLRVTSDTNADTVTTRQATLIAQKVLNQ